MKYATDKNGNRCSFTVKATPEQYAAIKSTETDGYSFATTWEHETVFVNSEDAVFNCDDIANKVFKRVKSDSFYRSHKSYCEVVVSNWETNTEIERRVLDWDN